MLDLTQTWMLSHVLGGLTILVPIEVTVSRIHTQYNQIKQIKTQLFHQFQSSSSKELLDGGILALFVPGPPTLLSCSFVSGLKLSFFDGWSGTNTGDPTPNLSASSTSPISKSSRREVDISTSFLFVVIVDSAFMEWEGA